MQSSKAKILIVSLQGSLRSHQAAETELMLRYREQGAQVNLLSCDAALLSCRYNYTHQPNVCATCEATCQRSADLVGIPESQRLRMDRRLFPKAWPGELPETVDALLTYSYEGVEIGRGVASTAISLLRDHALEPAGRHAELIAWQLCNALGAARNYGKVLDALQPDLVVAFNGRHVQTWPLIDLCQKRGVAYLTHEAGANLTRLQLFPNALPHSIATRQELMRKIWEGADPAAREEEGKMFFERRRAGKRAGDRVYVLGQKQGRLPQDFDPSKHNIVIFNSSEDEMKSVSEWDTPLYTNQNEAIDQIIDAVSDRQDTHLTIRIHPNLGKVDNSQTRWLKELRKPGVTVVRGTDDVDTYSLMDAADVIVTFGSTTGIEATYWGRPSVLYGHSFYEGLGVAYEPQSLQELARLVTTQGLPAKPQSNCYLYGYYILNSGEPYIHVEMDGAGHGSLNGVSLAAPRKEVRKYHLRYAKGYPTWLRQHYLLIPRHPRPRDFRRRTAKNLFSEKKY